MNLEHARRTVLAELADPHGGWVRNWRANEGQDTKLYDRLAKKIGIELPRGEQVWGDWSAQRSAGAGSDEQAFLAGGGDTAEFWRDGKWTIAAMRTPRFWNLDVVTYFVAWHVSLGAVWGHFDDTVYAEDGGTYATFLRDHDFRMYDRNTPFD